MPPETKLFDRVDLAAKVLSLKSEGKVVVFTNGCFDLIHAGHIRYLRQAKALGDCLIVGLNSDASVKRLKGDLRPLMCEEDRSEVLSALEFVDYIVIFDEDTPIETIQALKPDIHVKGGDYSIELLPEKGAVEEGGGKVVTLPLVEGRSTTKLIERIVKAYGVKQRGAE